MVEMVFSPRVHFAYLAIGYGNRVIKPFNELHGDKLYVITPSEIVTEEACKYYLRKEKEEVEKDFREKVRNFSFVELWQHDFKNALERIMSIVANEMSLGNELFFNLNAGVFGWEGSIISYAYLLSPPSVGYIPFVVNDYESIIKVPRLEITLPKKNSIEILDIIYEGGDFHHSEGISIPLSSLIDIAFEKGILSTKSSGDERGTQSARYMTTRQALKKPLLDGWIRLSSEKRNKKVILTKKGKTTLELYRFLIKDSNRSEPIV